MRFTRKRRAESLWVSWILLTAFTVAIGAFIFDWMTTYTEDRSAELAKSAEKDTQCAGIAIRVESICQTTQLVSVNVTNTKNVEAKSLLFRTIDSQDNVRSIKKDANIGPNDIKNFKILKDGITKQIDIMPVIQIDDKPLNCEREKITYTSIQFC